MEIKNSLYSSPHSRETRVQGYMPENEEREEGKMILLTRTSVYEVTTPARGVFKVKKLALLKGASSSVLEGEVFEGDTLVLTEEGLVLSKKNALVLKTSPIEVL